jgi:pilus assembly protein Flp/PilA
VAGAVAEARQAEEAAGLSAGVNDSLRAAVNVPATIANYRRRSAAEESVANARSEVVRRLLSKFLADETAATSLEYALIAAGISITIIGAVQALGTTVTDRYTSIGSAVR